MVKQPYDIELPLGGSGKVPLSEHLSTTAQTALILPNLKSSSLISIGQLCDDGCKVVLDQEDLVGIKEKTLF